MAKEQKKATGSKTMLLGASGILLLALIFTVIALWNPNRNYSEGLSFKVGAGQMIAGFDAGVVGMKVGETKTVKIPAAQAYGERSEENVVRFPIKDLGEDAKDAKVGMQVYLGGRFPAVITEITDTEIVFDANHELAGKDLIFDITIKNIAPARK